MKVEGRAEKEKKEEPMNNNFLLISLEEKKAKKIAEAINNDTSRKILDHLAKKECTESDLSKELDIPISTIHYNIKQLMEANLVIVDEFHYSSKGKEVNHYKLANKFIIIAPNGGDSKFMEALKKILPLTVITAITGGLLTIFGLLNGTSANSKLAASSAPSLMSSPDADAGVMMTRVAPEVSRPFMQSEFIAWFLIGAVSVIAIYFLYELIRRKK